MLSQRHTRKRAHKEKERLYWKRIQRHLAGAVLDKYGRQNGGGRNMYGMYNLNGISNNENNNLNNHENINIQLSKEKQIILNDKLYKYKDTQDGSYIYLFGDGENCFQIDIDIDSDSKKYAILQTFHNYPQCSQTYDSTGRDMLLAVVELLKEREDISYMELTDQSSKELKNGKRIPLADMYFVCTGKTWYGEVLPMTPLERNIKTDIIRVHTNTWNSVYACLQENYPDVTIPVDISDIDTSAEGSAMAVFNRIKEAKGDFFADYGMHLALCSGYTTFRGSRWRYNFLVN
jgi:hypothetical protein